MVSNIVIRPYTICVAFGKMTYLNLGLLVCILVVILLPHKSYFDYDIVHMERARDGVDTHNC